MASESISLIPKISEELHTYVQPIITHFLATWPRKSNIRLHEIGTWVNTNREVERGLLKTLLKIKNDQT